MLYFERKKLKETRIFNTLDINKLFLYAYCVVMPLKFDIMQIMTISACCIEIISNFHK